MSLFRIRNALATAHTRSTIAFITWKPSYDGGSKQNFRGLVASNFSHRLPMGTKNITLSLCQVLMSHQREKLLHIILVLEQEIMKGTVNLLKLWKLEEGKIHKIME